MAEGLWTCALVRLHLRACCRQHSARLTKPSALQMCRLDCQIVARSACPTDSFGCLLRRLPGRRLDLRLGLQRGPSEEPAQDIAGLKCCAFEPWPSPVQQHGRREQPQGSDWFASPPCWCVVVGTCLDHALLRTFCGRNSTLRTGYRFSALMQSISGFVTFS